MLSACAQLGILAAGLIARRHNAARVSMMSFSSAETRAESMCYHRRAYAPRTQADVPPLLRALRGMPDRLPLNDFRLKVSSPSTMPDNTPGLSSAKEARNRSLQRNAVV